MAVTRGYQEPKSFIFFFNELPLEELDPEELLADDQPETKNETGILAAACMEPLRSVLMSDLNFVGYLQTIYINFGDTGYYKFNPRLIVAAELKPFTAMLDRFFEHEEIRDAENNNIVLSQKITDPSLFLANLHATSRIVGCLDGNESVGATTPIKEYLENNASPSKEQPIIFVVGQILGHEIESFIHDYVRVSESKLETYSHLTSVINNTVEEILFG